MFENGQDTSLLRSALILSSNYLKDTQVSKGKCSLNDEETAAQAVVSTVNSLSSNLYGINSFHELFLKQQNIHQRCHAVVFINVLKSQNIFCPEANNFYLSVLYDLDNLNWSYYLKLNFLCHWSEYFIECASQLYSSALAVVLRKLLEVQCDGEMKFYAVHLALQTYIRKTFKLHSPSIKNSEKVESNFAFNFCLPNMLIKDPGEMEECDLTLEEDLPSVFDIILSHLNTELAEEVDINLIKVVFHGFKTIFKLVNNVDFNSEAESCIEKLNFLTPLFVQCLTEKTVKSVILQSMQKPFQCLIDSGYCAMSWEINQVYLVFLLENVWIDFVSKFTSCHDSKTSSKTVYGYFSDFHANMKEKNLSPESVVGLKEKYLNSSDKNRDNYFLLLTVIVKHHYPYASRAAKYLLSDPQLWEEYKVIELLEENVAILQPFELHFSLVDSVVNTTSKEKRDRLLNVFYKVLSQAPPEIYNSTLENILENWSFCESFMLNNFDAQLTQLSRKNMSLKEVENTLLPLFVQSPKVVLQFLIEQAMMRGIDGMEALKVLKTIPVACLHRCEKEPIAPLIHVLSPYFEHSLNAIDAKHFIILLKTLMEIQVFEDILSFDIFLDKCIFPNSLIQNVNQLEFTLECLNVSLDVLINNHALEIRDEKFIILLKHLGTILSFCIENSFGKLKETVVDIMELLSKHKKRPELHAIFENKKKDSEERMLDAEDIVKLYIIGIFYKEIKSEQERKCDLLKWKNKVIKENFQYLWIWCCITSSIDDFVDNVSFYQLSYKDLLKFLPMILQHLTKSEWLQAAKLIMYYQHLQKTGVSYYPWLLPDTDPELYGVIRCFMDSYTLILKEKSAKDILYCSSCLTNTIMGLLCKTTIPPSLLVNVFLDICCVSSYINTEVFFMFSSVLMSLQKQYVSVCTKANKKDCIKLMRLGLDSIQNDAVDKESLKDKLGQ